MFRCACPSSVKRLETPKVAHKNYISFKTVLKWFSYTMITCLHSSNTFGAFSFVVASLRFKFDSVHHHQRQDSKKNFWAYTIPIVFTIFLVFLCIKSFQCLLSSKWMRFVYGFYFKFYLLCFAKPRSSKRLFLKGTDAIYANAKKTIQSADRNMF